MFTSIAIVVFTGVLAFGVLFLIWRTASVYFKFRGSRVVTCPKTAEAAGVEVNAMRAAISGAVGIPALQLNSCSRWPENQDCGQDCLAEIAGSPESCLVRTILTRWYEKKSCVYCGTPLGRIDWLKHKPALMNPERVTFEWREIQAEKIPEVLATHTPFVGIVISPRLSVVDIPAWLWTDLGRPGNHTEAASLVHVSKGFLYRR